MQHLQIEGPPQRHAVPVVEGIRIRPVVKLVEGVGRAMNKWMWVSFRAGEKQQKGWTGPQRLGDPSKVLK